MHEKQIPISGFVLYTVCAWCQLKLNEEIVDRPIDSDPLSISHGICQDCADKLWEEFEDNE